MHGPCVKVTKKFSTGIDTYLCPRCQPPLPPRSSSSPASSPSSLSLSVSSSSSSLGPVPLAQMSLRKSKASSSSSSIASSSALFLPLPPIVQNSKLLDLSDEILVWILTFVRCQKSICRVSSTCKRLWRVAQDSYLWKYITLRHDASLRRHWNSHLLPRLVKSNIYELNLMGEISLPVMIDALKLEKFTGLQVLRLEDIQTYTVYRLASKLHWLRVFEARRIKGNSDIWDWRPFQKMNVLEELLLWRNEKPMQAFSLTQDAAVEISDDIYPMGEQHVWGGFVQLSSPASSDSGSSGSDAEGEDEGPTDNDTSSVHSNQSLVGSDNEHFSRLRLSRPIMPQLRKLALVNIVSSTTHRGTDAVMRNLVSNVQTFVYWNNFNILFPVVRTDYQQLRHLCLLEPCEPAWREGTWQEHAAVFQRMRKLETITLINTNMNRRYLIPILDAILALPRLRVIQLVSTEDIETIKVMFNHILETHWKGRLEISIQDDLGSVPASREWCSQAESRVQGLVDEKGLKGSDKMLELEVKLFRSEWDEDAGLKRLCLKVWQQSL